MLGIIAQLIVRDRDHPDDPRFRVGSRELDRSALSSRARGTRSCGGTTAGADSARLAHDGPG